ncbi:hypothetical protein GCM10010094_60070 [Streptomyces flaveus]|uniref:Uncharacterized protein n=1 Tax=Streptomyces flaveus TaxID=66370 RepID=A0A917VKX6_9ACTN|nr:hypothetical protein GCM10010094_60070 [Streptomyces flaveus]
MPPEGECDDGRVLREDACHPAYVRPVEIPGETVRDDDRELVGKRRRRALSGLVRGIDRDPVDRAQKPPPLGSPGCLK